MLATRTSSVGLWSLGNFPTGLECYRTTLRFFPPVMSPCFSMRLSAAESESEKPEGWRWRGIGLRKNQGFHLPSASILLRLPPTAVGFSAFSRKITYPAVTSHHIDFPRWEGAGRGQERVGMEETRTDFSLLFLLFYENGSCWRLIALRWHKFSVGRQHFRKWNNLALPSIPPPHLRLLCLYALGNGNGSLLHVNARIWAPPNFRFPLHASARTSLIPKC